MRSDTEMAEKYCWAITQAVGRSYCSRLGSSVVELGFQCGLPNTYVHFTVCVLNSDLHRTLGKVSTA